jgi:MFS family permease
VNAAFSPAVRRNVRLYYLYGFCMEFALWAGIWIKYLIEDRGFELKYLLLMDLPFWGLVAVLQAPTGALADHIGRKRVMAISGVLYAITILGFGFAANYWMLFFDYLLWAVAQSMRSGADSALLFDTLKSGGFEHHYQRIAGRGFAISLVATLVSIVAGAFIADVIGLSLVVKIGALTPLAATAAALLLWEPRADHAERHYWASLTGGMTYAWRHPQVRYTLLIGSVLLAGTFAPVVLVQPFLIQHSVSTGLYGIYQAPLRLATIVAAIVAVRVGLRTGVGGLLLIGCAVIVASYIGLALIDAQVAFALFLFPSVMQGLNRPVIEGYLHTRIPSSQRATVMSVMQLCFALQVMWFEPALGVFTDDYGIRSAFAFAVGYFLVLMPPLLFLWRRAQRGGVAPNVADEARLEAATP